MLKGWHGDAYLALLQRNVSGDFAPAQFARRIIAISAPLCPQALIFADDAVAEQQNADHEERADHGGDRQT